MRLYVLFALALLASILLGSWLARLWEHREQQNVEKKLEERDRLLHRRGVVAHEGEPIRDGNVKLTLRVTLTRTQAERLRAHAFREGKHLDALVSEILDTAVSTQPGEPS